MIPDHLNDHLKKLNLKREGWEYSFEFVYVLMILYQAVIVYYYWNQLPETIPVHFNFYGEPDGFGGKGSLIVFPVVSFFLYLIMLLAYKFPQFINVPWQLTEENLERQIKHVWRLLLILKGIIFSMMTYLCYQTIQVAVGNAKTLGYLIILFVLAIFVTAIWYFVKGFKLR